ncbi:uncharacterized protein N7496_008885 [Penicillium cataractarum]|uniref:Acyltransferase 3 domain-containing protein n=1 Tax=Penicillium cataractarum TaxID=2100454 RepID=A0A9W9RZG0_9EURO|nr:uncharacterized protein N7496_008885 [Penicillium cataractarum]KAJ5369125.1 hypothetical protein N7496_008885 [Penicillium cataractarum]
MGKQRRVKNRKPWVSNSQSPQGLAAHRSRRTHALDNLRTFLTALVIVHHTAIPYGGVGSWKIRSRCFPEESVVLVVFNVLNQTFFMGLFFFLSGYFTRVQISKSNVPGSTLFYSRVWRLLLPAILYTVLVMPTLDAIVHMSGYNPLEGQTSLWEVYVSSWSQIRGIQGQVWYLALVVPFDTAVILLSQIFDKGANQFLASTFNHKRLLISSAWTTSILSSFAIRIVYPVGYIWSPLGLQLAYLPQYILAYTSGNFASISDDYFILDPLRSGVRKPLKRLVSAVIFCLASLAMLTALQEKFLGINSEELMSLTRGGFNVPALMYAAWNEMGFALVGFSLLAVFLRYCDTPWLLCGAWLPRYSYAAFLIHPLVSLVVELVVESVMDCGRDGCCLYGMWVWAGPVILTLVVGLGNVFASWIAAWAVISRIPYIGTII